MLQSRVAEAGIYTETLARLYLQQGFVARALAIYRRLAQEQPENQPLHERLYTLEQQYAHGALGHDVVAPCTVPDLAVETTSMAPHRQGDAVVAQLERWLDYLRRQHCECP